MANSHVQPDSPDWDQQRDRRSARRAAVRRHHPDAGGTAEALIAAFAAIDDTFVGPVCTRDVPVTIEVRRAAMRRLRTRVRRWRRRRQARHYFSI